MADLISMLSAASGATAEADPNFKQTVLLLHGDGTNGAQNNTFLDGSTNNFTITRNGNTTQGTFSPFSLAAGEWGYFGGTSTSGYLQFGSNAAFQFGTGDFTVECWAYFTTTGTSGSTENILFDFRPTSTSGAFPCLYLSNSTIVYEANSAARITTSTVSLHTWNHIALVRSGTDTKVYINGVQSGSTYSDSTNYSCGSTNRIGNLSFFSSGNRLFNGYISNFRIVKGTAVYTTSFTPPTTPLTAITNTSLLTCQSNRFVDNSTNAFAITSNGDVRVTPFSPFAPTAAYSAGTNGGSGYFDGSGDYLQTPSNSAVSAWSTDCTIECWFYLESLSTVRVLLGNSTANSDGFFLAYVLTDGKIAIGRVGVNEIASAAGVITTNQWYHVAFIKSSTTATIYVNGVSVASGASSAAFETTTTKPFSVGVTFQSSGSANWLGYVSNVRVIKNQALTTGAFTPPTAPVTTSAVGWTGANVAASITGAVGLLLNFTNAGIFDNTGKNNLETVGNAQIDTTTKKYGTGSLEFDGTGDYLKVPDGPDFALGSGNFTIECWVYPNNLTNPYALFGKRNDSTNDIRWVIAYINTNGTIQGLVTTNGSTWAVNAATTSTISASAWSHIAVVRNGSDFSVYVNGTKNTLSSGLSGSVNVDTNPLTIGQMGLTGNFLYSLNGYIDDLRITKGVARYTANFTAPTKAFPDQ